MKSIPLLLLLAATATAQEVRTDQPRIAADTIVATEQNGFVIVEAEHFFSQTHTDKRAWHISDATRQPSVGRDIDAPNFATASGGASIEVLPDEGNNGLPVIDGVNFSDPPGQMAIVSYRIQITNPGRYYIWSRAYGTDGDDNSLHYGIDGTWPETSTRSWTFAGQKKWQWANRHRKNPGKIYFDIPTAGTKVVMISMREDGCELDQFVLTTDVNWTPPQDEGPLESPVPTERNGVLVVEAEDLLPSKGWEERNSSGEHTGRGYIAWTLPGQGRPPGEGVLRLRFRIATAGDYQFLWRSRLSDPANRPETRDPDGNDTWLRILTGSDVQNAFPLGSDWRKVALFDHPAGWSWSTNVDKGPPHPDNPVIRHFDAGIHLLELSGRSLGHLIDRFVLLRIEQNPTRRGDSIDEARLAAMPSSPIE